jgi:AcrR family transcriptional regulator
MAESVVVRPEARPFEPQTGLQTRTRVLREAARLFAERGFQATTIRDLASQAGVNIAAINYHFRSKEELHSAVLELALAEWSSEIVAGEDLSSDAGLERVLRTIIAALVAPVIERDGNRSLLRLVAWMVLEPPAARTQAPMRSFELLIAQLIDPFLPDGMHNSASRMLAQWLVGQCLLISPALQESAGDQTSTDPTIDRLTQLALGGFVALRRQDVSPLS